MFSAFVFDFQPAFLDVDIRSAVFAHGAQFNDVRVRTKFPHRKDDIGRYRQIVFYCQRSSLSVEHGVGGCRLLCIVYNGLRTEFLEYFGDKIPLVQISNMNIDLMP